MPQPLPIDAVLADIRAALRRAPNLVLQAPPGAGKTTRVPLALLDEPWMTGKLLMLEPRRLAARGAAARMAETLGEGVGETVGWRIRGETRVCPATRIEVLTEGVLTRMLQSDPDLSEVSAVVFDEIHERSLNGDLGLALALEAQAALRPELRLVAMSATLDAAPVAALMGGAEMVSAEGRAFPVETIWRDAPLPPRARLGEAAAETALRALAAHEGDALVFLPGAREIGDAAAALSAHAPEGVELRPLYGDLPFEKQRAALAPAGAGRRKIVLSTAIAETSLTVEGVRIVVDAGRARRARFDAGSGMARLRDEPASRAEADQRRGRAGRTGPGACYRLWTKGEEGARPAFAPPEMLRADLAPLALELAVWGASPEDLAFLDPPPAAAFAAARALLTRLGALDDAGRATGRGRKMAAAPAHPRLAAMMLDAGAEEAGAARALAALLSERDPLRAPGVAPPVDLTLRLEAMADARRFSRERSAPLDRAALARVREAEKRLARGAARAAIRPDAAGRALARGFPDRIAMRRPGDAPRYLLSGGKGARLDPADPLAAAPYLVVAETDGDPTEARIRLAAPIARGDLEALFADELEERAICRWSRRDKAVTARLEKALGALVLESRRWADVDPAALGAALADGVRDLGLSVLPWSAAAQRLQARIGFARAGGAALPDCSEAALCDALDAWLTPHLSGMRRIDDLAALDMTALLDARIGWDGRRTLDEAAPAALTLPDGARAPIDYSRAAPTLSARAQSFYGMDAHPHAAGGPVTLELLSPARRPIATTADLPGFWRAGWLDARKDMRGRYPRHDWPERPWEAPAKPRRR